ncbi:acetyltransferase (GNAT) family domain-containing protein [Ditylenchus destructor]|nr:acetyltransferase (GNAT) family domain-containing protein [Ditylenchus destructor]
MTTIRPFEPTDLFRFNNVNLDPLTETYGLTFYLQYLMNWPEYFQVAEHQNGQIMGYIMGKAEGRGENWHGHVTALSIAPQFRRQGLAATFMENLEKISESKNCYFVDLFVRVSNETACKMYTNLGYIVYRRILEYYSGDQDEDAFDMRKALSRDVQRKSVVPLKSPVSCNELEQD